MKCPHCELVTKLPKGIKDAPEPARIYAGLLSLCLRCGGLSIWGSDRRLHKAASRLSPEEFSQIVKSPTMAAMRRVRLEFLDWEKGKKS